MVGKGQSAGTCDHRMESQLSKLVKGFRQKVCQCFLNVGKMTLVIREKRLSFSSSIAILTVVEPMSIPNVFCMSCKVISLLVL